MAEIMPTWAWIIIGWIVVSAFVAPLLRFRDVEPFDDPDWP